MNTTSKVVLGLTAVAAGGVALYMISKNKSQTAPAVVNTQPQTAGQKTSLILDATASFFSSISNLFSKTPAPVTAANDPAGEMGSIDRKYLL